MGADPFTIMAIAGAASSVVKGIAAGNAGKANQGIHNYNATVLRMEKESRLARAKYEADLLRDKGKRKLSSDNTAYMKSGVEVAGSPVEVLGAQAADIELDALFKVHKGELEGWELENQAAQQEYMGEMAAWRGRQQKKAAFGSAAISLVGAAWGASGGMGLRASPMEAFRSTGGFTGMNTSGVGFFDTMQYGVSRHPGIY